MARLVLIVRQFFWFDVWAAARDPLLVMLLALMPLATVVFADSSTPTIVLAGLPAVTAGTVAGLLMVVLVARERFDGTLTRLRALPRGIAAYVVGRTATMLVLVAIAVTATIGGAVAAGMALPGGVDGWARVVAGVVLGAVAWAVIGLIAAGLLPSGSPMGAGSLLAQTVILAVVFLSANIQPVGELPGLARAVVQVMPAFWSGHLVRHGLLGDGAAAGEPGGEWQPGLAVMVIGAWIGAGGVLASLVLRRGARRGDGRPVPMGSAAVG